MKEYKNLLLDLDGTIIDSGPGIMESVQYALDKYGIHNEPMEKLRRFVGPSLAYSFHHFYGMDEDTAREAVAYYREVYAAENIFHAVLYDGIAEAIKRCDAAGNHLYLVTSKPEKFSMRILEKFSLTPYFRAVSSPEMSDASSDKSRLINALTEKEGLNKEACLMIGDTRFDMAGAVSAGVDAAGVTYGYGSREELLQAGAAYLIERPEQICTFASCK